MNQENTAPEERLDLLSLSLEQLKDLLRSWGEKPFRASQLYAWLHQKLVTDVREMTNLPVSLRERLAGANLCPVKPVQVLTSKLDGTQKYLFALEDGNVIESVLMQYHHGSSVCISSQAGCRMGCRFCASTIGGLKRHLKPSELLGQVYQVQKLSGSRVDSIVIMGTGEPLDNYENLLTFLRLITAEEGLHLSQRAITVSTCGLVERIRELAGERLQITLALSLHASTQEKRRTLMPVANRYELHEVIDACRAYETQTGRRVTYEYSLVAGVNDTPEDVRELAALLTGMQGQKVPPPNGRPHINLIPVNPIKERSFRPPERSRVLAFQNALEKTGLNVTIRREMGRDIAGACGQLRRSYAAARENRAGNTGQDITITE